MEQDRDRFRRENRIVDFNRIPVAGMYEGAAKRRVLGLPPQCADTRANALDPIDICLTKGSKRNFMGGCAGETEVEPRRQSAARLEKFNFATSYSIEWCRHDHRSLIGHQVFGVLCEQSGISDRSARVRCGPTRVCCVSSWTLLRVVAGVLRAVATMLRGGVQCVAECRNIVAEEQA